MSKTVGDKVDPPCVACGGASPTSRLCGRCEAQGVEAPELPFEELG